MTRRWSRRRTGSMRTPRMSPVTMFPLTAARITPTARRSPAHSARRPRRCLPHRLHHSHLLRGPSGLPRMLQQVPPTTIPRRWALLGPKLPSTISLGIIITGISLSSGLTRRSRSCCASRRGDPLSCLGRSGPTPGVNLTPALTPQCDGARDCGGRLTLIICHRGRQQPLAHMVNAVRTSYARPPAGVPGSAVNRPGPHFSPVIQRDQIKSR